MREITELIKSKNFQLAEQKLIELLQLDNNNLVAKEMYGFLELSRGNYEKSKLFYEEVLTGNPKNQMVLYNLGLIYEKQGQKEKSILFFSKCLEVNSSFPQAKTKLEQLDKAKLENEKPKNTTEKSSPYGLLKYEWSPSKSSSNIYYFWAKLYSIIPMIFLISMTINFIFFKGDFAPFLIISFFSGFISLVIALPKIVSNLFAGYFNHKTKYRVFEHAIEFNYSGFNKRILRKYMYQLPEVQALNPFPLNRTNDWVLRIPFEANEMPDKNTLSYFTLPWGSDKGYSMFMKSDEDIDITEEIRVFIDKSAYKDRIENWKI
jgi:tetratricopeptide (TPR) repeat protein